MEFDVVHPDHGHAEIHNRFAYIKFLCSDQCIVRSLSSTNKIQIWAFQFSHSLSSRSRHPPREAPDPSNHNSDLPQTAQTLQLHPSHPPWPSSTLSSTPQPSISPSAPAPAPNSPPKRSSQPPAHVPKPSKTVASSTPQTSTPSTLPSNHTWTRSTIRSWSIGR